jgi:hypothetical protein
MTEIEGVNCQACYLRITFQWNPPISHRQDQVKALFSFVTGMSVARIQELSSHDLGWSTKKVVKRPHDGLGGRVAILQLVFDVNTMLHTL